MKNTSKTTQKSKLVYSLVIMEKIIMGSKSTIDYLIIQTIKTKRNENVETIEGVLEQALYHADFIPPYNFGNFY